MNSELIKNIDALAVNYISLKTLKREEIHPNNPIAKYYNENIMSNHTRNMTKFIETLLGKNIDDIPLEDLYGDDENFFSKYFDVNNVDNELYGKLFESNTDVELTNDEIQEMVEQSYKLYNDLDNIDASSDKNILPMIGMIFGNEINTDEIVDTLKEDFSRSFLYIVNNVEVANDKVKHIKRRMIEKDLSKAISNENYLIAEELKAKLNKLDNE